jgi:YidC/Oxa1 family membrane protein insertase
MLTAEMHRILLLVALAATAYLLVLAWNDDYNKPQLETPVVTEPMAEVSAGEAAEVTPATRRHDVPAIEPSTASESAVEVRAPASETTMPRLVHAKTDTMEVWIDRLGGDIVRVQLPRFPVSIDQPNDPFLLLDRRNDHIYIAQSGLIGRDGPDAAGARPLYDAANNDVELSEGGDLTLTTSIDGVEISKVFSFSPGEYVVDVKFAIHNRSNEPFEANLFAQLKRDGTDLSGSSSYSLGPRPYLGAALTSNDERYHKLSFSDLDKGPFRQEVTGGWVAMLQHYFIGAWVGNSEDENRYYGQKQEDDTYIVGYTGPVQTIRPHSSGTISTRFYAGPKDQARLEAIAPNLNLTVDYGFLWWLAGPLFRVLEWLHDLVGNWGVAIILLTLIVKLVLYPLSAASYKSMANMRRVGPQMKRLQERYADDRQKLSQEMMAFYKKEKINPLGGCLPMLLQMPVFLALYWVLFESVELRQAPFIFWIRDLAVLDPFFVLPILMGGSMFLTQALNPPVPDPVQARVMKFMPIMFTVMFLFFPAGLVLYWLVNNLLSLAQQWYITRQIEGAAASTNK